ncbi:hypothetical protein ACRAWD_07430 [Caulobacter segnis]
MFEIEGRQAGRQQRSTNPSVKKFAARHGEGPHGHHRGAEVRPSPPRARRSRRRRCCRRDCRASWTT